MALGWYGTGAVPQHGWTCGYCGKYVGGSVGYHTGENPSAKDSDKLIYICPHCENPTAFIEDEYGNMQQVPSAVYGNEVGSLPESINAIYQEVRRCIQYTAYTSAVLSMRKLLMHVAVECGAPENASFIKYVNYLDENHYIPPNSREWVDAIRQMGNEAVHEIIVMREQDAKNLLDFAEMLLRIVYEFPAKSVRR